MLLCFINPILGNRYGAGVSSCRRTSDNLGWPDPHPPPGRTASGGVSALESPRAIGVRPEFLRISSFSEKEILHQKRRIFWKRTSFFNKDFLFEIWHSIDVRFEKRCPLWKRVPFFEKNSRISSGPTHMARGRYGAKASPLAARPLRRWLYWSPPLPLRTDPQLSRWRPGAFAQVAPLSGWVQSSLSLIGEGLSGDKISWVLWSKGLQNPPSPTMWRNLEIFLSPDIGPGNRTQDSVVTSGTITSYATETVSDLVPLITTESWVRFPGPISGDRNISRFHHNVLADNLITSLVCILCGIYLCASPPVISYEEMSQYIGIQRITIVLAGKSEMRGSTSLSPEIEDAHIPLGWNVQAVNCWTRLDTLMSHGHPVRKDSG